MKLTEKVQLLQNLFDKMHGNQASSWQVNLVREFKDKYPELEEDLNFCFEVLAGKHKLGYTYDTELATTNAIDNHMAMYEDATVREFYDTILRLNNTTADSVKAAVNMTPSKWRLFFQALVNRLYRLGYSGKSAMVTDKHCMLAKTYPEFVKEQLYYVQEKLNGTRCISYYDHDNEVWKFLSRSQLPKDYPFDMTGLDINRVYDGEVMHRTKMGNRDFAATVGIANSKYGDKSKLVYFIYDILDSAEPYFLRLAELNNLSTKLENNNDVKVLPVLDMVQVSTNPVLNTTLDGWLDKITAKGGEGIMLRDPAAPYYHSKHSGDRRPYLLKYKKTKTCDLRIVGWNPGRGKYTGLIGSFICQTDDGKVKVHVAGMTDGIRMSNPNIWINQIIEVAYFEQSNAKNKATTSLQFPRMKSVRLDKTETSMF